jgi:hypothetical protein
MIAAKIKSVSGSEGAHGATKIPCLEICFLSCRTQRLRLKPVDVVFRLNTNSVF